MAGWPECREHLSMMLWKLLLSSTPLLEHILCCHHHPHHWEQEAVRKGWSGSNTGDNQHSCSSTRWFRSESFERRCLSYSKRHWKRLARIFWHEKYFWEPNYISDLGGLPSFADLREQDKGYLHGNEVVYIDSVVVIFHINKRNLAVLGIHTCFHVCVEPGVKPRARDSDIRRLHHSDCPGSVATLSSVGA